MKKMVGEEKPEPQDSRAKILTGVNTESNAENNASFVSVTAEDVKAGGGGFPTDVGGKQNVQDPIPSMVEGGEGDKDGKMRLLLKVAIAIFILSLLILSMYIIGSKKREGSNKEVELTPSPVMTSTPQAVIATPLESATPSASTTPDASLEESTQSSFLQTATPSSSPEL